MRISDWSSDVCSSDLPSVPALAAVALMSAEKHPSLPATLTMMGGPIDTREAPTAVNELATTRPHSWFEQNVIATVTYLYHAAGRRVYPIGRASSWDRMLKDAHISEVTTAITNKTKNN